MAISTREIIPQFAHLFYFASVVASDNTRNSSDSVQRLLSKVIRTSLTVVLSADNTLNRFINPSFSSLDNTAFRTCAASLLFSDTFLPVVEILSDCFGVIVIERVKASTVVMPADCADCCPFPSVAPPEYDGGVLSVRALNLDVIRFTFFDCCRDFFKYFTVRQHFKGCCHDHRRGNLCPPFRLGGV